MQFKSTVSVTSILILLVFTNIGLLAQTEVKPGFNLFSPEQDVEIGQKSAQEIEKELPILQDSRVQRYVSEIGQRLAGQTPGPDFPYQFKVVNVADVNAFALPGGYMYVNRGLIEAANSEGELAGVMGHEISHVALRHGTNQASKAYLAQAGLGILGAIFGGGGGTTSQIIGAVGGFGLNATFLKFSRDAEKQADLLGSQILARSGYNPMHMAGFFEELREMSGGDDPSGFQTFFSSHPPPADRAQYVAAETRQLDIRERPPVGDFDRIKRILDRMPKAPTMKELAEGKAPASTPDGSDRRQEPVEVSISRPSDSVARYQSQDELYRLEYPDNWHVTSESDPSGVTILPRQGMVQTGGQAHIVYGVIVNRFQSQGNSPGGPFSGRTDLGRKSNELLAGVLQNNSYLRPVDDSVKRGTIDGRDGLMVQLRGPSPVTGMEESVTLVTRELSEDQLLYALFIFPERDRRMLQSTFNRILKSIRVDDDTLNF